MTGPDTAPHRLCLADSGETADLIAFLARLIHYDRAAAVRLQAGGGVLAVFGRPPSFEVLAIRTALLAAVADTPGGPGGPELDTTVSAGRLADALDAALPVVPAADGPLGEGADRPGGAAGSAAPSARRPGGTGSAARALAVALPEAVTGPPWAGVLPPRGGWQRVPDQPTAEAARAALVAAVAEFRTRDGALPAERRTRAERDRIGREIWSRTLDGTELPLRAVHAAQALGFLRPAPAPARSATPVPAGPATPVPAGPATPVPAGPAAPARPVRGGSVTALAPHPEPLTLLSAGAWLRLRTPYGSVAVRRHAGGPAGFSVAPV